MGQTLETWDLVAVGVYFTAVIAVGIYSMCRAHRGTVSGYFLAGRYMFWLPVGASLFASNIGSEHFIGLAGSGAAAGIGVGAFELNALIMLQLLGWVFLPVYMASKVCTLPEFMKKRFGGHRIRIYLSVLSVVLYILTKVSVNLYSGALFIQQALHWNLYVSIILLLAVTAFCTVTGGLTAVIYTDTLQAFIMIGGAAILTGIGFNKVGGYQGLYEQYGNAIPNTTLANVNETCGYPRADAWTMLRDPVDSDIPWPGFLLGQTPASVWYWCADQMMVQRALAAKSLSHAQGATLFAGYLKLLPLFLMVMPGMISRVLYPDEVACVDPDICEQVCGSRIGCSNIAFPKLVLELMPTGLRGVMMSVMLAALMSDLTSIFNSASTLFTMDIYRYIRKNASNRELMIVGRSFVCVMIVIGIAWMPTIQNMQGAQLYLYIQSVAAYLSPPIAAVYSISILWKRANEPGAFWGLMVGVVVGVIRMVLDFVYIEPPCGEPDTRPGIVANVHYMYFAMILFWLTALVTVVISLLTEAPSERQLIRVTYWTRFDQRVRDDEKPAPSTQPDKSNLVELVDKVDMKAGGDDQNVTIAYSKETGANKAASANPDDLDESVLIITPQREYNETEKSVTNSRKGQGDRPKHYFLSRMCDWFCGLENDDDEEAVHRAELQEAHVRAVTTLKQDRCTWVVLNTNLVILCALCVSLYVFFSIGTRIG